MLYQVKKLNHRIARLANLILVVLLHRKNEPNCKEKLYFGRSQGEIEGSEEPLSSNLADLGLFFLGPFQKRVSLQPKSKLFPFPLPRCIER